MPRRRRGVAAVWRDGVASSRRRGRACRIVAVAVAWTLCRQRWQPRRSRGRNRREAESGSGSAACGSVGNEL
uniref:Uncharacterized protein n=1 Tax=Oryza sativa subsp. japonica TaxID=39947 RepID=Q69J09_ORYSJ|nr:hypothetical protein [Oryza sativa Japonica Group]BAD34393.1 hypothetical protein [Oryza sativa Japonica Group]